MEFDSEQTLIEEIANALDTRMIESSWFLDFDDQNDRNI